MQRAIAAHNLIKASTVLHEDTCVSVELYLFVRLSAHVHLLGWLDYTSSRTATSLLLALTTSVNNISQLPTPFPSPRLLNLSLFPFITRSTLTISLHYIVTAYTSVNQL